MPQGCILEQTYLMMDGKRYQYDQSSGMLKILIFFNFTRYWVLQKSCRNLELHDVGHYPVSSSLVWGSQLWETLSVMIKGKKMKMKVSASGFCPSQNRFVGSNIVISENVYLIK